MHIVDSTDSYLRQYCAIRSWNEHAVVERWWLYEESYGYCTPRRIVAGRDLKLLTPL